MTTLMLTFAIFLAVVLGMSIGALINKKAIHGSCGGLSNGLGKEALCDCCADSRSSSSEKPPSCGRRATPDPNVDQQLSNN